MPARRIRQDSVQVILRMEPEERARLRAVIPRGDLNAVAVDLLLRYAAEVEQHGQLPREGATTAA